MRRLRVRFTLRAMMVLVALLGGACLLARVLWTNWLRDYPNPVRASQLSASAGNKLKLTWKADQPTPVVITYNFGFISPKNPPGTTCVLFAEVWFEDQATGRAVDCYTFDALLTAGAREAASGSFDWDARLPGPGRYQLRYVLHWQMPSGELNAFVGGSRYCQFVPETSSSEPANGPGATP